MKKLVKSIAPRGPISLFSALLVLAALVLTLLPKAVAADEEVPIKGTYAVTFTLTPTSTSGVVSVTATGIGNTSHLGRSFIEINKTANLTATPPSLAGTFKLTTQNGDSLSGALAGVFTLPDANGFSSFSGQFTFTGGSGPFQGASGSANFIGLANFGTHQAFYSFDGSLSSRDSHN
jgi:hypothetical protein